LKRGASSERALREREGEEERLPRAPRGTTEERARENERRRMAEEIVLYDMGLSPYATIVRLMFAEKGLTYKKRELKGMTQENLEPWYANINPKMEVPSVSLASGGEKKYITDSRDIIEYFEKTHEGGTSLVDPKKSREIWSLVDLCYQIKLAGLYIRGFKDNSPAMADMMRGMTEKKLVMLETNANKYPEQKEHYLKKKEVTAQYIADFFDSDDKYAPNKKIWDEILAKAEEALGASDDKWLFGEYSIADVVLTAFVAACKMFGLASFEGRPLLQEYWANVVARPSYKAAGVSEDIPMKMKVMMAPMLLFFKVKGMVAPWFSKGMKEAQGVVNEIKDTANDKMNEAIGVSK